MKIKKQCKVFPVDRLVYSNGLLCADEYKDVKSFYLSETKNLKRGLNFFIISLKYDVKCKFSITKVQLPKLA